MSARGKLLVKMALEDKKTSSVHVHTTESNTKVMSSTTAWDDPEKENVFLENKLLHKKKNSENKADKKKTNIVDSTKESEIMCQTPNNESNLSDPHKNHLFKEMIIEKVIEKKGNNEEVKEVQANDTSTRAWDDDDYLPLSSFLIDKKDNEKKKHETEIVVETEKEYGIVSQTCSSNNPEYCNLDKELSDFVTLNELIEKEDERYGNNKEVETENGEILLEVEVNDIFTLPSELLNEMKQQNIVVPCIGDQIATNLATNESHLKISQEKNIYPEQLSENLVESEGGMGNKDPTEVSKNNKRQLHSKREETKTKRLKGEEYIGYSRSKDGKIEHNVEKEKRQMKSRCSHKTAQKQTIRTLMCGEVSEEMRMTTFKYFWNLEGWGERKSYIRGLVSTKEIRRRRKSTATVSVHRKKQSHDCFLPLNTGKKVLVCRKMLLNTLALGRNTFERWTTNLQQNTVEPNTSDIYERNDNIASHETKSKTNLNVSKLLKQHVRQWLQDLPKVPSHYCRSSSKKLYLESVFRSTLHVYKEYRSFCMEHNKKWVGRTLFQRILKSENIAIHKPRKDQCDLCCSWKTGNISEEDYNNHIKKKNEAEMAKREAKESISNEKLVVTMDLQSVLLAPKLEASAVYYKQKLQIHNFTVYALNNKNVDLYVWHESNGGVSANEFTSCIVDFITKQHQNNYKHITLISDGCGYQNRNKVLSSALLRLSQQLQITIEQLILERGHTMMEADSVHSALEAYFKPPIYAPSDYITRMRQARDHHPYRVHNLNYFFFRNYEKVDGNLKSIKPEKNAKVTWPLVSANRQYAVQNKS